LFRQFVIFLIFISFTFSTIDELVKLCFEKIETVQELTDTDDSESDNSEKKADLDKIINANNSFFFYNISLVLQSRHVSKFSQLTYKQVIYIIISPPPEV
jgi:hypothetical protein